MENTGSVFPIVSFDGMHRSGKGTQIQLLKKYCEKRGIDVYTFRGEYYRFGSGVNDIEDPFSERRQENKYADCYKEKSQRLNRELRVTLERILPQKVGTNQNILIILDRSIIGRYMQNATLKQPEDNTDSVLEFNLGAQSTIKKQVIIPDTMIVFKPTQEELYKRLFASKELFQNHEELLKLPKYNMIHNKYDEFYGGLASVPVFIKNKIKIIGGDLKVDEIHNSIVDKLLQEGIIQ